MKRILIVEDEHAMAAALSAVAKRIGCDADLCYSGEQGLERLGKMDAALVVLDIGLPDASGLDVLRRIRATAPDLPVLVVTAHGNLDNAVAARKLGASAYLVKPLDLREVQETFRQLLDSGPAPLRPPSASAPALLVGAAPAMQRAFSQIANACASDVPVLITGPTGCGKTLAARVIHTNSARRESPFVTLQCSAMPETLLESELFGHERNAFTGAAAMKPGHIERARGGTLFLDEIADVPPAIQAKLLRFVEERVFTRVGGREDLSVDLRLVTATNRDLREEVRAGRFREDLYYRLHVLAIDLPPLRERPDDIPALCAVFLGAMQPARRLSPETLDLLCRHPWPGNVRELRNALEHAAAVAAGKVILPQHLPSDVRSHFAKDDESDADLQAALGRWLDGKLAAGADYDEMHAGLEALALAHLLSRFDRKPTVLARTLGINRVTLRKKCRRLLESGASGETGNDDGE